MSVAAAGGGMGGSDDDEAKEKKKNKGKAIIVDVTPVTTDEDEDEDEDEESEDSTTLDSIASLEASLPIKRGLSEHYHGKSASFENLVEISIEDSSEVAKKEHPLNKKRKLIAANKIRIKEQNERSSSNLAGRAAFMSHLPEHPNSEDENEEDEDNKANDDKKQQKDGAPTP